MASFFMHRGPFTPRFGPGLVLAGLACWGLAGLFWVFPAVAALLLAIVLVPVGLTLVGIGLRTWRVEAGLRRQFQPPSAEDSGGLKDIDVKVRDKPEGPGV